MKPYLDVFHLAGLLQAAHEYVDDSEVLQEDEHAVVVNLQNAIAGGIVLTADVLNAFAGGRESVEVNEAADETVLVFLVGGSVGPAMPVSMAVSGTHRDRE